MSGKRKLAFSSIYNIIELLNYSSYYAIIIWIMVFHTEKFTLLNAYYYTSCISFPLCFDWMEPKHIWIEQLMNATQRNNRPHLPHQWNSHNSFHSAYVCVYENERKKQQQQIYMNILSMWVGARALVRSLLTHANPARVIVVSIHENRTVMNMRVIIIFLFEKKIALQFLDIEARSMVPEQRN